MTSLRAALAASTLALGLSACGPNLCDRSTKAAEKTRGDCGAVAAPLLGDACNARLGECTPADQELLSAALGCAEKISTCSQLTKDAWRLQRDGCTNPLAGLSQACADAFFQGVAPGVDAGQPDAGLSPITDGGQGVLLVGAANQDTIALAWEPLRQAGVAKWYLVQTDGLGQNRVEAEYTPGTLLSLTQPDAGTARRRFFIAGLGADGALLTGAPFVDATIDAGVCAGPNDCPDSRVCSLGQCVELTCPAGQANTCPAGYGCLTTGYCARTTADGGIFSSGGRRDAGTQPLPMLSNEIDLTPRPPMPTPVVPIGASPGRRPDVAALDTARVAVALEQEAQLICHPSSARGADLSNDATTSFGLDTLGARVHLAWSQESGALYACYIAGRGVRLQRSDDRGRTWGRAAVTYEPPLDDAGVGEIVRDCDIAAWKDGGVVMVTAEPEALVLREFSADLTQTAKSTAFLSTPADAGMDVALFNPSHPAIAALPSTGLIHVTFTGTRFVNGARDTEPYGVFREGASAVFAAAQRLTPITSPSPLPEDWTTVAIHPKTGRAVGAYTTVETGTQVSTVYVALFVDTPQGKRWSTGSHLNVLGVNTQMNVSLWLPQKAPTDKWFAFSPQFAPLPDGTFAFSFVAGPNNGSAGDYRLYLVPFDLERVAATTTAKGWYVPPVLQLSPERVLDPRGSPSAPQPPVSALAADSQISVYGAFVAGGGPNGDVEGPAQFFSWP